MKKAIALILLFLIGLSGLSWLAWERRVSIAEQLFQKHLGVPVTLKTLDISENGAQITQFSVQNPRGFRSKTAFQTDRINIYTTWQQIRANPLTIDSIQMDNLFITLEEKRKGSSNWDAILKGSSKGSPKGRHWLIKTLTLNNLTVQVIKADGSSKTYPTIKKMEFYNLSDESGFPVSEIERAIFNEMMKNIFKNLDLRNIIEPVVPGTKYLPTLPGLF